jgi:hypothetical protein
MINITRASAIVAIAAIGAVSIQPAMADTLYASAGYVNNNPEVGDYYFDNTGQNLFAATFTLTQKSDVTGVGGVFTQFGDGGTVFASIIAAPAQQTAVNTTTLPGLSIADAVFAPPSNGSDVIAPLSVTLNAGTYELVIGSGLFGATGQSGLATGMNGQATLAQSLDGGATWGTLQDSVRVTVDGTVSPVPLPSGLPLLGSGLAACFGLFRRRRDSAPVVAPAGRPPTAVACGGRAATGTLA